MHRSSSQVKSVSVSIAPEAVPNVALESSRGEEIFKRVELWLSSNDDKPPKGFEKFFKKKDQDAKPAASSTKGKD
jgi:hypothetical protein